jgi:hypothetical protein
LANVNSETPSLTAKSAGAKAGFKSKEIGVKSGKQGINICSKYSKILIKIEVIVPIVQDKRIEHHPVLGSRRS